MHRVIALACLVVSSLAVAAAPDAGKKVAAIDAMLAGHYDNHAQHGTAPAADAPATPLVRVDVEPTPKTDWMLWHVRVETDPASTFEQTWALQTRIAYDGSVEIVPYYQFRQNAKPAAATFDPEGWLSLEACALRGPFDADAVDAIAEGEPCVAVSMGVGARRALLPVGIHRKGDALELDMDLLGARMNIDARKTGAG